MRTWISDNSKKISLFSLLTISIILFQNCYVSKNLDRDVKISINEVFPIAVNSTGEEGFTARYTETEYLKAFLEGLNGEFDNNKIIVVKDSTAEFIVTIDSFSTTESSTSETVNDANSAENGLSFTLTSIENRSSGSIISNNIQDQGTWFAVKNRNEKLKSRTKKDGTTTHNERDFTEDAAIRFADAAGRRAGARIVNDIHGFLK
jgi:hypothetical protein